MPLIILILAIIGFILLFREDPVQAVDPNSPEGKLQAVVDAQKASVQESIANQTQGTTLTQLQAEQIRKFGAIATVAGTVTTIGVAGLSSLTLAAAGPVGAVVAGVIIAIGALRGTAHLVANQWTQAGGVQDQFGKALGAVSLEIQTALQNGSATKRMMAYAVETYNSLWRQYYTLGEEFASIDNDHREVIDNSYCDFKALNCRKGKVPLLQIGLVNALIRDTNAAAAKLKV